MSARQFLAGVATVALLVSSSANAQAPNVPAPNTVSSRPPPMGPPPGEPTSVQRELATKLVDLLQPDYELSIILANKLNPMAVRLTIESPDNAERARAAQDAESKVLKHTLPVLKMLMVEGYAREMTQDQLEETLKFLATPSGMALSKAQGRLPRYFEITGADMWGS